ncbi:Response regulator receiver domain-containing protein [Butyrivibrio sp. ob235]|uniref:response regulator n=1 Tax=Butyrivibrio sp. ob235 TaxID=1761780 RepID=UPI0008C1A088|nr:response regulator [Butyrivibrio sp. ob235]SEK67233.1 Response regulator receiver domain-containing protein [Butyrivibrio sp. ob235]
MSMGNQELMLIGIKETFVIRALENKLREAGIDFFFVTPDIDVVSKKWDNASAIAYYLDQSEKIEKSFLHYLNEHLTEDDKQIIIIGEKVDTDIAKGKLPSGMILKTFLRPLDVEDFIETVKNQFSELLNPSKKSIMVVDDDATYIGLIRDWLREKYTVSMAVSGLQAIRILGRTQVDLILLDYEMPITSGPQVLEMLRNDPSTRDIPVIFLTGKSDKESVMKVVNLKPEGYLLKSIKREELMADLQRFFAERK